ncbi:MAG: hypothetical protein PUB19_03120 [Lachnospiraceae bacterium]|nr:hypothetical protein [Lachnospiraceae bacterium]
MQYGVLYHDKINADDITDVGFSCIEMQWNQEMPSNATAVSGIVVPLENVDDEIMEKVYSHVKKHCIQYVVLETVNCCELEKMEQFVDAYGDHLVQLGVHVYIENGYVGDDVSGYRHCVFSEIEMLRRIVAFGNRCTSSSFFGICVNIGYGNILAKNVRGMMEEAGDMLCLVHANDNDGFHNDKQMPYTFTKGRGKQTTDWQRIIGALWRIGFDGIIIFDTEGLFERAPKELEKQMLKMLYAIAREWENALNFETMLNHPEKKLILFGAGLMAANYMTSWGGKYPPAFFVDNNQEHWGKEIFGIPIKSPQEILSIPEDERTVLICNMYYDAIGQQLQEMGVPYQKYIDHYYNYSDKVLGE